MLLLDQYILKKFLVPFIYCIVGFTAIWLVWNLSTNLPDFVQGHVTLAILVHFYATQIPNVIVQSIPVGTLLALLYSMTQMSRSNEIISILCSGRSLYRIFYPFFFVGFFLVIVSSYFNYEKAPQAEALKNQLLDEIIPLFAVHEKIRDTVAQGEGRFEQAATAQAQSAGPFDIGGLDRLEIGWDRD